MSLLTDEKVILESERNEVSLTTHRVRYESRKRGFAKVVSIMLGSLTSSEITHRSQPWMLVLAAAFMRFALYLATVPNSSTFMAIMLIIAGALVVAYFLTREEVVSLASPSAAIKFRAKSRASTEQFIDAVARAKNDRYIRGGRGRRLSRAPI